MLVLRSKLSIAGRCFGLGAFVMIGGSWATPAALTNCNWSGANLCPGMLAWPVSQDVKQAYKDVKKAVGDAKMIQGISEVGRAPKRNGRYAQFALPSVNSGATTFDLSMRMPDGVAVILGTIQYRDGMGTEGYYGVPSTVLTGADSELQTFVLIGDQPSGYPVMVNNTIVYWGKWHLFQTVKKGNDYTINEIEWGNIEYCEHTINPTDPVVRFIPCATVTQVFGKADSSKVSRMAALNYVSAISALARRSNVSFSREASFQLCAQRAGRAKTGSGCWPPNTPDSLRTIVSLDVPMARKQPATVALLQRFSTLAYDESLSPYWFSCGLGCCTADQ